VIDLGDHLADLGNHLDLTEREDLSSTVVARLGRERATSESQSSRTRFWLSAAVVLVVVAALVAVVVPASRSAIADWFGLDGVEIRQHPDLTVPAEPTPFDESGPGTVVDVGATEVLVATFDGRLEQPFIDKALTAGSAIERVDVGGAPGLWIDGAPHIVTYRDPAGRIATQRVAGNTLLWQDGDVIHRVEGFTSLASALAFATASR
jgi:hypothetical protein